MFSEETEAASPPWGSHPHGAKGLYEKAGLCQVGKLVKPINPPSCAVDQREAEEGANRKRKFPELPFPLPEECVFGLVVCVKAARGLGAP